MSLPIAAFWENIVAISILRVINTFMPVDLVIPFREIYPKKIGLVWKRAISVMFTELIFIMVKMFHS